MTRTRIFIYLLAALWAVSVGASLLLPQFLPESDDGFTRNINRLTSFLGIQAFAFMLAVSAAILSQTLNKPKPVLARVVGLLPLSLSGTLLLAFVGFFIFARLPSTEPLLGLPDAPEAGPVTEVPSVTKP